MFAPEIVPEGVVIATTTALAAFVHCVVVAGVTEVNVITGAGETPANSQAPQSKFAPEEAGLPTAP